VGKGLGEKGKEKVRGSETPVLFSRPYLLNGQAYGTSCRLSVCLFVRRLSVHFVVCHRCIVAKR